MNLIDRWALGSCVTLDLDTSDPIFFPKPGRPPTVPPYAKYCEPCPIVNFCLSYALIYDEEGVWGNTTKNQRDHLLSRYPELRDRLIQEASEQGWYFPRQTVEELIQPSVPEEDILPDTSLDDLEFPDPPELEFVFLFDFEQELPLQTPPVENMPLDELQVEPLLEDSPNDQLSDSSEFRFEFELL